VEASSTGAGVVRVGGIVGLRKLLWIGIGRIQKCARGIEPPPVAPPCLRPDSIQFLPLQNKCAVEVIQQTDSVGGLGTRELLKIVLNERDAAMCCASTGYSTVRSTEGRCSIRTHILLE